MKVLVLAPHADDEVLGAGGTICRMVTDYGWDVTVCVFYDRMMNHTPDPIYVGVSMQEAAAAQGILNYRRLHFCQLEEEDCSTSVMTIIKPLEAIAQDVKPEIVIGPYQFDLNQEHRRVAEAMRVVFRPFACPELKTVLAYEIPGSTCFPVGPAFQPSMYIDVSEYMMFKLEAFTKYKSEFRGKTGHPRSIEGIMSLAGVRGAECGVKSAEAFQVVFARAPIK